LLYERPFFSRLILCDFRAVERLNDAQAAFEVFVASLLAELGLTHAQPQTPPPTLDEQASRLLSHLEQATQPVIVLLDHAECLLGEQDILAACWLRFFTRFLRSQHRATVVLATNRWAGWYHGEQRFVVEQELLPLSTDTGVLVLQQSGLDSVPVPLLEQICAHVGGLPLCLEWVAALVKQPLVLDEWDAFGQGESPLTVPGAVSPPTLTHAVQRLLAEPHIFGGSLADAIAPLLERIIATQHLSVEAQNLLHVLAVATLPLAKPALQVFCPQGPRPIKELRNACMLVAYPKRTQVLPTVASAVYRHLTEKQRQEQESLLIQAYSAWVQAGTFQEGDSEQGAVMTELAVLLLKQHRLLEAAEHVIRYGWISFNLGQGPRLARLAKDVMGRFEWHATAENDCAGILLHYFLTPFLGAPSDSQQRFVDHQSIREAVVAGKVVLPLILESHLTNEIMVALINQSRFDEAQTVLEAWCASLKPFETLERGWQVSFLEKRAWFFAKKCEHSREQGEVQTASLVREQAITLYRECRALLSSHDELTPLMRSDFKKRLARVLNNLSYHLTQLGQYEEALQVIEESITLKEQGYTKFESAASSYGQKAEVLMELGRFQEALLFEQRAFAEMQRLVNTDHTSSQQEIWVYPVIRGQLYLRLGRVEEAEHLLREALPHLHLHPGRRTYHMFAEKALKEIEQWRRSATSPEHQVDWRWVERYRQLDAYDAYWWLAYAGPFTQEEQQQWDRLFTPNIDETTKDQLGGLLAQSCERELAAALAEQREPYLHYPAIEIAEVRRRITAFLQLDADIHEQEPNAIVRRLYHGAIEDEVAFLGRIEATYQGESEHFWELSRRLYPEPTQEEMQEALSHVRRIVRQGLQHPQTAEASHWLVQFLHDKLQLSLALSSEQEDEPEIQQDDALSIVQAEPQVSSQAIKRFFESALAECGYEGWQVVIDTKTSAPRVEPGLRHLFIGNTALSLSEIRHYFAHEFAGHVARAVAGERSPLGLLGINTKNYLPTEEGLALYHERSVTTLHGQQFDDSGLWLGVLAVGLASGMTIPPQTFLSLVTFLEALFLVRHLLQQPDQELEAVRTRARQTALIYGLRTYRGVPDLNRAGACDSKDTVYLRGLRMIERAVAQDETVLDRLAVGKIALEALSELQELGITASSQALRTLAYNPDLDSYILSFDVQWKEPSGQKP
jgi:tetratricopeptide (TPR) repeat protein